jgi:hypothetical protein
MTDADRAKLRAVKGCGLKCCDESPRDLAHWSHDLAVKYPNCDPCLDLLMEAARAGAVEECAKVADKWDDTHKRLDPCDYSSLSQQIRRLLLPPQTGECEHEWRLLTAGDGWRTCILCNQYEDSKP